MLPYQDQFYSPSLIRSITEENKEIAEMDHKASYSVTLARRIVSNIPSTKLHCIPQSVKYVNRTRSWNLSSYIDITDPLPAMVDLGYSLLANPDLNMDNAISGNSHPDIKPILLRMVARCNRCFVIHIAATLGIHPLLLEAELVEGATRLLSCKDCHRSKIPILKSVLSQDGQVNADILRLVFPTCLYGTIIRIVKIDSCGPFIRAIAYRNLPESIITKEVNLLLYNGHFTILSDINFLKLIQFKMFSKSANNKIGWPLSDFYELHNFKYLSRPLAALIPPLARVNDLKTDTPVITPPDSSKKCKCGGTDFKQILNCFVCSKCDQHTVISAQTPSTDMAMPLLTGSIDPLSLDTYSDEDDSVAPNKPSAEPVFA
jgi:hypothetical protein